MAEKFTEDYWMNACAHMLICALEIDQCRICTRIREVCADKAAADSQEAQGK